MVDEGTIDIKLVAAGIEEVLGKLKNMNERIVSNEEKTAQAIAKIQAQADKKKITEAQKTEQKLEKELDKWAKAAQKEQDKEVANFKKAEAKKTADFERAAAIRVAANKRANDLMMSSIVQTGKFMLSWAARIASTSLLLGGGLAIKRAISYGMSEETAANKLSRETAGVGKGNQASQLSATYLRGFATQIQQHENIDSATALGAGSKFLAGVGGASPANNQLLTEGLEPLIHLAKAEGQDIEEFLGKIGEVAKGQNLTVDQLKVLGRLLISSQRNGGMTPEQTAAVMPGIKRAATAFSGKPEDNMIKLLSMENLSVKLGLGAFPLKTFEKLDTKSAAKLNAQFGSKGMPHVTDKSGNLVVDPEQFVAMTIRAFSDKSGKVNREALSSTVGARSMPLFEAALKTFNETTGDADEKLKGLMNTFAAFDQSILSTEQEEKDHAQVMSETTEQWDKAVREVTVSLEAGLTPAVKDIAQELSKVDPTVLGKFATAVALVAEALFTSLVYIEKFGEGLGELYNYIHDKLTGDSPEKRAKAVGRGLAEDMLETVNFAETQYGSGRISKEKRDAELAKVRNTLGAIDQFNPDYITGLSPDAIPKHAGFAEKEDQIKKALETIDKIDENNKITSENTNAINGLTTTLQNLPTPIGPSPNRNADGSYNHGGASGSW